MNDPKVFILFWSTSPTFRYQNLAKPSCSGYFRQTATPSLLCKGVGLAGQSVPIKTRINMN